MSMAAYAPSPTELHVPPALARLTFDALLSGAARIRPGKLACSGPRSGTAGEQWTFGALDAEVRRLAASLQACGLREGETVYIAGAMEPRAVVLAFAALRAGLHAALGVAALSAQEHASAMIAAGASAAAFPGGSATEEAAGRLMEAAGQAPSVRFVAVSGADCDGAVRLESAGGELLRSAIPAQVVTFDRGHAEWHDQRTLVGAALNLMTRAQLGAGYPILSLMSPMRVAGLCAGPLAGLVTGAPVHLHGPFSSAAFSADLEQASRAHLVAPGELAAALCEQTSDRLVSLVAVWDGEAALPLPGVSVPVTDVFRFGEWALAPEPRDPSMAPARLPGRPHHIPLDADAILAVEMQRGLTGGLELRGAAVTGGETWRAA